jgi:hypothetical protein
MALDGVALHGRRGDGFRGGVLAANARDGLTAKARSGELRPALRVGLVAAGYGGAFLIASAAVAIRVANTSGPAAQASSGMYAFGDFALFIALFGFLALVPTGAALYFLRPYRRLWVVLSALALSVVLTGVAAVLLYALGGHAVAPSLLATWAALSVLRILLAPVLAPTFLVSALLSSHRSPRLALLAATALEVAVGAYAGFVWFLPLILHRN